MGARGKKSAADLAVVSVNKAQRPAPWPGLTPDESKYWNDIIASLPADWFGPSDQPLLAAYCQAVAQLHAAHARLAAEPAIESNAAGSRVPNPNFKIIGEVTAQLARLATKLRLCPSARYDKRRAATLAKQTTGGPRPWEFNGRKD